MYPPSVPFKANVTLIEKEKKEHQKLSVEFGRQKR
jgi:hypothetical protein